MIGRSDAPAIAALVACPARSECAARKDLASSPETRQILFGGEERFALSFEVLRALVHVNAPDVGVMEDIIAGKRDLRKRPVKTVFKD